MSEKGWCVRFGQEGVLCVRVGEIVWNTLKVGGIEKRGVETKILKKWGVGVGGKLG